jgi:hypothetical protein
VMTLADADGVTPNMATANSPFQRLECMLRSSRCQQLPSRLVDSSGRCLGHIARQRELARSGCRSNLPAPTICRSMTNLGTRSPLVCVPTYRDLRPVGFFRGGRMQL